jgi:hypothetical protein
VAQVHKTMNDSCFGRLRTRTTSQVQLGDMGCAYFVPLFVIVVCDVRLRTNLQDRHIRGGVGRYLAFGCAVACWSFGCNVRWGVYIAANASASIVEAF